MKKRIIIICTIVFVEILQLTAQEIYVNSQFTGDSESGSLSNPYKTIQKAVDNATKGDIIYIMAGTYREQVEIGTDSIIITPYEDDKVIVSGTEPVLEWQKVAEEVYSAIVPWDISENDQSNQIFVDGEMIHLARWPKQQSKYWVTEPDVSVVDAAENSGTGSVLITDNEFDEPKDRWLNGMIWVNLAHDHDGNGWCGKVSFISSAMKAIKASPLTSSSSGVHAADGHDPWAIQKGSEYYLLNPTPAGVYKTGGPEALLARGEWWKNADTLFVRLPNGEAPASSIDRKNLVEAKKRIWAFTPENADSMHHVTIKGLHLFAASITTDKNYLRGDIAINSHDNIIDSLQGKYIMHFIDVSGHYGLQWKGRCGIIVSGINNTIKNSTIQYSAGSGVSAVGRGHRILNNRFYENNYQVTEAGVVQGGVNYKLYDPEIAYNFFYNNPHIVIVADNIYSTDPETIGKIRIHHNVIMNFMLRSSDGGAINCSAGRSWDNIRVDHNIIANSHTFISFGIYTDYGGDALFDHNVIYNVERPIAMNRYSIEQRPPIGDSKGGPIGEIRVFNNTVIPDSWSKAGIYNDHVNPSGEGMFYKNNIIANRISATLELAEVDSNLYIKEADVNNIFADYENHNFQLNSTASNAIDMGIDVDPFNDSIINNIPDIGAYEYGMDPWKAGPEGIITNIKISGDMPNKVYQTDTIHFSATAFTSGFVMLDPQPEFHWSATGSGRIDQNGVFIADSIDNNATVYVTADSLLFEKKSFKINELVVGINEISAPIQNRPDQLDISIFPNPANRIINVSIGNMHTNKSPFNYTLYDLQGRAVQTSFGKEINDNNFSIQTGDLDEGFYLIDISLGEAHGYKRFVIDKQ